MKTSLTKSVLRYLLVVLLASSPFSAWARVPPKPPVFVLVPATWQGGWYWQQVSARLRATGAVVYTPSLSGLAEHQHTLNAAIN
ncbi:MAG: hypothetical protein H7Z21_06555, partial [Hymenobacter sp.]|nr:hypothetical protein [Hymenobacter sp.]